MYLKCGNNNHASTVLSWFSEAVDTHGLRQQILGRENVDVWRYMFEQHSDTNTVITGSSTHNEQIEWLWHDVYRCVGVLYQDTFRTLEENGKYVNLIKRVYPLNKIGLHYIFLPRICKTHLWSLGPEQPNVTQPAVFSPGILVQVG